MSQPSIPLVPANPRDPRSDTSGRTTRPDILAIVWDFIRDFFARASWDWAAGAAIFLGTCVLGLIHLGNLSFWFDETFSIGLASQPARIIQAWIWGREPNMELYYMFLHNWLGLTSTLGFLPTEVVVRLPSVIFGAMSVVLVYFFGLRFFNRSVGLIASILYGLSFYQLMYAQMARSYSMQLFFIVAAWYAFFSLLSNAPNERVWWAVYILTTSLAIYAQLFSALILIAQIAGFAVLLLLPGPWRNRARSLLLPLIISLGVTVILILPMIKVARHGGHISWVAPATFKDLYFVFFHYVAGENTLYLIALTALVVAALGLALVAWLPAPASQNPAHESPASGLIEMPKPGVLLLFCWVVLPVAISFAVTQPKLNLHLFYSRYEVVIVPALCLLVGIAAMAFRGLAARIVIGFMLVALAASAVPYYYAHAQIQDFRTAVFWLQGRYQSGDGIVCFPRDLCSTPVQTYFSAYPSAAHFDADSPGQFSWARGYANPDTLAAVQAYAAKHDRIFYVIASLGGTTAELAQVPLVRQWLATKYTLTATYATSGVLVQLYTRKPIASISAAPSPHTLSITAST